MRKHWLAAMSLLLLGACANEGAQKPPGWSLLDVGTGVDAVADTDGPETDSPGGPAGLDCLTVCFEWVGQPVLEPDSGTEPLRCNLHGLTPGECPDGSHCEARDDVGVCVVQGDARDFSFDLAPLQQKASVTLVFRLQDGGWPASTGDSAGYLELVDSSGRHRIRSALPRSPDGRLTLSLPEGVWDLRLSASARTLNSPFPPFLEAGRLQVASSGLVVIEIPTVTTHWDMEWEFAAGEEQTVEQSQVTLNLKSQGRQVASTSVQNLDAEPVDWLLSPGEYTLSVDVLAQLASGHIVHGRILDDAPRVLGTGEPQHLSLQARVLRSPGRIVLGGLPVSGATIRLVSDRGITHLTSAPDGRFEVFSLEADYEVWVELNDLLGEGSRAVGRVDASYRGGTNLPIRVSSAPVRGEVTGEDESLGPGTDGALLFMGTNWHVLLPLAPGEYAFFAGELPTDTYEVWAWAPGRNVGPLPVRVATEFRPVGERQTFRIKTRTLPFELSLDGSIVRAAESLRGELQVHPTGLDPEAVEELAWGFSAPIASSLHVSLPLQGIPHDLVIGPSGLTLGYADGGFAPFGYSEKQLLPLDFIDRLEMNLETTTLNVGLLWGSEPLDDVVSGNRGRIHVGTGTPPLASRGPSRLSLWLLRGVHDLDYECDPAQRCLIPGRSGRWRLVEGLGL